MKWVGALVTLVMVYLFYGIFLNRFDLRVIPGELTAADPAGFHDYAGVINVQTKHSTGSGTVAEVALAAQEAGVDFLFITDLNRFEKPADAVEGYHGNVLVFIDGEYSYLNSRILNLGVSAERDLSGPGRAQVFFADMLSQRSRPKNQGFFVLAHPLRSKYTWVGEFPSGLDGIEIINLKSVWQEAWNSSRWSFFWSMFVFPFNDRLALIRLFREPRAEVRLWDDLNQTRPTIGFAGADADSRLRLGDWGLNYPSYQTLFSLVRNHILLATELTGNAEADREKILGALSNGQFYVSLDTLADPKGFIATVVSPKGDVFPLGSKINWQEGLELKVRLPHRPTVPFEVEIYRDGERIVQANSQDTAIPLHAPGVYRVKVRVIPTLPLPDGKQWITWIYTNPFYIRN